MSGKKFDEDKLRLDLIPPEFIETMGRVLTFGAEKYGADNWQKVKDGKNRYYAAAMRHLLGYRLGQQHDKESQLPHLSHLACCVMFLFMLEFYLEDPNEDTDL